MIFLFAEEYKRNKKNGGMLVLGKNIYKCSMFSH